jgi:hypothetical protein
MSPGDPLSCAVAVRETHISVLVLIGDRVYKLKKPVSFDFVDFSTHDLREKACHREVELPGGERYSCRHVRSLRHDEPCGPAGGGATTGFGL